MYEMPRLEKQKSQSGQALVEYVLLIAIASTLLLGLANQFYKPFGNWVQNQMGPYLECLLDVGELPALGGDTSGECANQFQPFSPGAVGGGNPPRTVGSNGNNGSNANLRNSSLENSGNGSGGKTQSTPINSSGGRNKGFPIGKNSGADGSGNSKENQVIIEKLPESKFFKLRSAGGSSVVIQQRIPATGINGLLPSERARVQKREGGPVNVGTVEESESTKKTKAFLVKPTERKTASEEDEKPWTFGEYFKYAVILMIIIAIILFLAGQVAQISKSMEK